MIKSLQKMLKNAQDLNTFFLNTVKNLKSSEWRGQALRWKTITSDTERNFQISKHRSIIAINVINLSMSPIGVTVDDAFKEIKNLALVKLPT